FAKTKVDEQYYVNAKGEKNGTWKRFWSENGVLVEEATFVNGELHGLHKVYDPTSGKALLSEVETYSHNVRRDQQSTIRARVIRSSQRQGTTGMERGK